MFSTIFLSGNFDQSHFPRIVLKLESSTCQACILAFPLIIYSQILQQTIILYNAFPYYTIIDFPSATTQRLAMFGQPFQIQLLRQSFWIFHQNSEFQYWSFSRIHLLDVKNNRWKMSAQDVESAVSAASRAFPAWSGLTPEVTFFNYGY